MTTRVLLPFSLCLMCVCAPRACLADSPGVLSFTAPVFEAVEPTAALATCLVTVSVARTDGSFGRVSVDYNCWIADGLDTAESYGTLSLSGVIHYIYRDVPNVYVQRSGTLVWTNGDTSIKSFTVTLQADAIKVGTNAAVAAPRVEGTKTLSLVLANPGGGAQLGPYPTAVIHILDAQAPPEGALHFARTSFYGGEHTGYALITVKRTAGARGPASVRYVVNNNVPLLTLNTTNLPRATPGPDYPLLSGTLLWDDGDSSDKSFVVPILDDTTAEGPETANVALFDPTGAQLGWPTNALVIIADDDSPLADVPVPRATQELRIWYPQRAPVLKGMFVYMAGSGGDSRWVANYHADWKGIIREWGFAVMGTRVGTFASAGPAGIGPFLDIMRVCGETIGRLELCNAPCAFTGYSLGGISSAYSAMALPSRTVALVGYMGGYDLTYRTPGIHDVPALFIAGQKDNNSIVGAPLLRNMFLTWRTNNCAAAYAVAWNVAHKDNDGQNYEMGLLFLDAAVRARYPTNQFPGRKPGQLVQLNALDLTNGWLAQTPVYNAPTWDIPIAPFTNYLLDPSTASWLPNAQAAHAFRAFTSLYSNYYPNSFPPDIPYQSPPQFSSPTAFGLTTPNATLNIDMNYRGLTAPTNVVFSFDALPLGACITAPWTTVATLSNAPGGAHLITALCDEPLGPPVHGMRVFAVQTPEAPLRPTCLDAQPAGPAAVALAWKDNSSDESGFYVARLDSNDAPVILATLPANTTSWLDTNAPPDHTSTYCVAAYNTLGASAWSDEAAAVPGAFAWSGRGANPQWTTAANWHGDSIPTPGAHIIFTERAAASTYASGRSITLGETVSVTRIEFRGSSPVTGALAINGSSNALIEFSDDACIEAAPHATTNTLNCCIYIVTNQLSLRINDGALNVPGTISDTVPAALIKDGRGSLTLSGDNSYRGGTFIKGGALIISNSLNACGSGPLVVANGCSLHGIGTIHGALSNAGIIMPGLPTGALHAAALVLASSSRIIFELGAPDKGYDTLFLHGDAVLAGTLTVTALNQHVYGTYTLITASGTLVYAGLALEAHVGNLDVEWLTNDPHLVQISLTPEPTLLLLFLLCMVSKLRKPVSSAQ